jgi:hypothetical protein
MGQWNRRIGLRHSYLRTVGSVTISLYTVEEITSTLTPASLVQISPRRGGLLNAPPQLLLSRFAATISGGGLPGSPLRQGVRSCAALPRWLMRRFAW